MAWPADEVREHAPAALLLCEKAAAGPEQRRLSLRHRDHQTGHDEQQTLPLEGHDEDEPERLIGR
jgi:hypothetical protein